MQEIIWARLNVRGPMRGVLETRFVSVAVHAMGLRLEHGIGEDVKPGCQIQCARHAQLSVL